MNLKFKNYHTLEVAADILGTTKEKLLKYACEHELSLAVRISSIIPELYESSAGKCEYEGSEFIYLSSGVLELHKEAILSKGVVRVSSINWFNKYPIGSEEGNKSENMFTLHVYEGDSQVFKKFAYERAISEETTAKVYITRDALISCEIFHEYVKVASNRKLALSPKQISSFQVFAEALKKLKGDEAEIDKANLVCEVERLLKLNFGFNIPRGSGIEKVFSANIPPILSPRRDSISKILNILEL